MFFFQKPFSTLYCKASNLLGCFVFVSKNIFLVCSLSYYYLFADTYRLLWLHLGKNGVFVDIQWQGSISTLTMHDAETKARVMTPV